LSCRHIARFLEKGHGTTEIARGAISKPHAPPSRWRVVMPLEPVAVQ
jgi:hypothetical protein